MPFRVRNTFHLRLSVDEVITLCVYLDDRHINWMSQRTLKSVVSDLKPLIRLKLEAERDAHLGPGGPANAKKGTVDVHRGETYQFAYFLRKAEPHTIVLKTRNYILQDSDPDLDLQQRFGAKPSGKRKLEESPSSTQVGNTTIQNESGRRPRKRAATSTRKQRARKGKTTEEADNPSGSEGDGDEETLVVDTSEISMPTRRRSVRTGKKIHYLESDEDEGQLDMEVDDEDDGDSNYTPATPVKEEEIETTTLNDPLGERDSDTNHPTTTTKSVFDVDSDEEEKAKKPVLQLSFRELNMLDRSLCVVIEPWPALRYQTTPAPSISRVGSMAPPPSRFPAVRRESEASFLSSSSTESGAFGSGLREQTPIPLFLPDHDERGHSSTPAPIRFSSVFSSLETFPENEMRGQENEEDFGMLAFSQVLNNVASDRVAVAEDDDEMDGGALYGDADEIRESIM